MRQTKTQRKQHDAMLRRIVTTLASTKLWRDIYPDGPDILDNQPLVTPEMVRDARLIAKALDNG